MIKNKNYRKKLIITLIIAVLVAILLSFFLIKKDQESKNSNQPSFIKVTVAKPKNGDLENSLSLNGIITPRTNLIISSELSSVKVKNIFVEAGTFVKKDQKLAQLDVKILDGNLDEISSDYELAKDEFFRVEKIKDSKAISRSFYMEKKSRYEVAKARLSNARTNLNHSTIRAPFSGLVYERNIEVGSLVNANEKLFSMTKSLDLDLEVQAPEDLLSKINIGDKASIEIIGSDHQFIGKVRAIIPRIDPDSRNFAIKIALKTGSEKIAIGTFGTAKISTKKKSGLTIPATAMQDDGKQKYLYIVNEDQKIERRNVNLIMRSQQDVLIEGIKGDENIVLKAGSFVREGDIVEPVSAQSTKVEK